ncbi:MAG: amino acid--tRNA ligase-related protein [Pseudomonadota bacterium]
MSLVDVSEIKTYSYILEKLRYFFQVKKHFVQVLAQPRLSILAACEDPKTISPFIFSNIKYPLPQTGQMWLEEEILKNPDVPGVFCITTSYRDEPNPIPGRHLKVFPMFEFESHGTMEDMRKLENELVEYLGFNAPIHCNYEKICNEYNVREIKADLELTLQTEISNEISLEYFPLRTHPFWNMKRNLDGTFNKIDVILYGMETIGSAERSTNTREMREIFHTLSDGEYAKLLFDAFGVARVTEELDRYLALPMFSRYGGGIGLNRLARAMTLANLIPEYSTPLLAAGAEY